MRSDILVIGGGIAGISAAARLSEAAQVTVLEAENALGYHASGRSAALIEPNYGAVSVQVLNRASLPFLKSENGGYLTQRGLLIVARPHEKEAFEQDVQTLGVTPISVKEALTFVPMLDASKISLAAHHSDAHDIDTDRLIQDFARTVRQNGGQVLTDERVTDIRRESERWHVQTGKNTYFSQTLVNAAGAWADAVAEIAGVARIGLTPCRRSMARIPAPGGLDVSRWPMFFGVGETWYAKPDAGALIVSPAEEDPTLPHDAFADDLVLAEGLARYEEVMTEPVTRLLSSWAGLRTFAPDRTLVLGRAPDQPDFVWCAGQGGYGIQTSPAASRLLADLVLGRPPDLDSDTVAALSPDRFA
jgi:glycine/D-amino acid oxidase-like deaminating enzyme